MLVTLAEIMNIAEEKQIAIGAFNAPNLESLQAVIAAAEELQLPVIIQHAQCHENLIPMTLIGPLMIDFARRASVPVCVHLDHGETLYYVRYALEIGFTSVMYDGSNASYEKNVINTRKVVEMARRTGASVEAELGCMGRSESGAGDGTGEEDETKIYTDPDLAKRFVEETDIDALACSFGTTHGIYLKQPKLDFSVVEKVRQKTNNIPIVMHGGSGVSTSEFHKAIQAGVRKINYFTYMNKAAGSAVHDFVKQHDAITPLFYSDIVNAARQGTKEDVKQAMRTFALLDV